MNTGDDDIVGIAVFNDDKTPMEFVVLVLEEQFGLSHCDAADMMLRIHHRGFAIVETLPREEARRKLAQCQAMNEEHARSLTLRIVDDPEPLMRPGAAKPRESLPRPLFWLTIAIFLGAAVVFVFWLSDWVTIRLGS